jgi:hypothetical protein
MVSSGIALPELLSDHIYSSAYVTPKFTRLLDKSNLLPNSFHEDVYKVYVTSIIVRKDRGERYHYKTKKWVDNIKTDLGEIEWGDVDWIFLHQDRDKWRALVNAEMNIWVR